LEPFIFDSRISFYPNSHHNFGFLYLTQPKLQFVAQAPFFSEIVLLMGSLNLISLYWIITALKPSCSIFKLAAKNRKHTSDQVAALTISLLLTLFWIFMVVQSFDLAALILMSVITVTMNFLTFQLWLNDLTEFQQFLIGEQPDTEKP
jgi:hypothetical protein